MSTEPCLDCFSPGVEGLISMKGDGKCATCSGSGKTAEQHLAAILSPIDEDCPDCDGTGMCQSCGGTGWLD